MIVYCCADLIFATKIASTAVAAGLSSRPARDLQALRNRLDQVDDGKLNEAVSGVIVDLELGPAALELIEAVKAHSSAVPVVAFGSHVATDILQAARQKGADYVLPRSQFTANLPEILHRCAEAC